MFRKIAGTAFSRLLNAILAFATVVVAARVFGAEGYGTIVLVIMGIALIQLVNNIIGGPALVYLVPRNKVYDLIVPAYIWALVVAVAGAYILNLANLIPSVYYHETMLLALIANCSSVNLMVLVGKEKIRLFNLISVLQSLLIFLSLLVFHYIFQHNNTDYYIYALFIAYTVSLFSGFLFTKPYLVIGKIKNIRSTLKQIVHYGGLMQLASIIQFFNYRLSYYLVEKFFDKAELGKFAVGVQLAEGMWLISKSIALVQYSRISNEPGNLDYAKRISLLFLKSAMLATFCLLIVLLVLPNEVFIFVFRSDFDQIKPVIFSLSPGILTLSASHIFSHYFSGTGKPQYNTKSSAIGFVIVLISGFILIPLIGPLGAGIATSLSYISIFIYQLYWFIKVSGTGIKELLLTRNDIATLSKELRNVFHLN